MTSDERTKARLEAEAAAAAAAKAAIDAYKTCTSPRSAHHVSASWQTRREVSADNVAIGIFKVLALLAGAAFMLWLIIPGTVFAWHFWKDMAR